MFQCSWQNRYLWGMFQEHTGTYGKFLLVCLERGTWNAGYREI